MSMIHAGDVYLCNFSHSSVGSMQTGLRPCVIVDNNNLQIDGTIEEVMNLKAGITEIHRLTI